MTHSGIPDTAFPHIAAEHVSFAYPAREASPFALHDVTAAIARGSITGLLGPNGSGKSTLLKILAGIVTPHSGRVLLDGQPLSALSRRDIARRIAVVPQSTRPAFDFTALEMVLMGRHPHLGAFQLEGPQDVAIARDALAATGTATLADRSFLTLSGGEQQRVVIASALAQAPHVLLLDEPTASLDLGYQLEIGSLLADLNRQDGVTMVIATHDLNFATRVCDRLVMMIGGRVLASGPTVEVLTRDTIRELYHVEADIEAHGASGGLIVVPTRRSAS